MAHVIDAIITLKDNFSATLDQVNSNMNKFAKQQIAMGKQIEKTGRSISEVGSNLTKSITMPILGIGTAATKMAMDAIESENLFEVSMGEMAKSAREWSEVTSKALGLNAYDVRKNVGTFNVMLTSMGQTKDEALKMSEGLTQLSYDMASFYNLKPEEAFEKLKSGISGETEPLKSLGILVNETQVKTYALSKGIIKQGQEMTDAQKIQARYGLIMQATSKAQGDLSRTMDSPTNQIRILKEGFKQASIQLGTAFIPILQKLLPYVKRVADYLKNLTPAQQEALAKFMIMAATIGPVIFIFGTLVSKIGSTIREVSSLVLSIKKAGGIMSWLMLPGNQVVLILLAIIAAVGLLYLAWTQNWGGIRDETTKFINDIKRAWNNLKEFFAHPIQATIKFAKEGSSLSTSYNNDPAKKNALGTSYFGGGWTWVGEHGPELMKLPTGAQIKDNRNSEKMNQGSINIEKLADKIIVREDADIDKIATALVKKIKLAGINM